MALALDDRVKETSTTTGTGTLDLSGAVSGFQTFVAGVGDGNTTYYAIVNRDEAEWEVGLGTVTDASTDTLARTTVISSSNSDSATNFSAGTKDVFVTLPASKVANLDTNDNLTIGSGSAGVDYTLTFDGADSNGVITWMEDEDHFKIGDDTVMDSTKKLYFNDEGGEYISGDTTDLTIASGAKINLTATSDVVIPANVGITFGTGEKIEGDSTNLTITSGADIALTATSDINVPANVGMTFGDDGEKIEGDGTDLTISGNTINLTATTDVALAVNTGILFAGTEKIESDGTDLSITVGASGDINIGSDIGLTFGDDGEKIEGDGTDLTIASSNLLNLTATTDIVIPTNVGLHFTDSAEKIESDGTDFTFNSGNDINLTATTDINVPSNVGITFGDDGEKIEGDGSDLTISGNTVNLDSSMNHTFSSTGKAMVLGF